MKYNNYISEDVIAGTPSLLIGEIRKELIDVLTLTCIADNFENVCTNLRMSADIFQLLGERIDDDFILLKYNPMGHWYKSENKKDNDYWKEKCRNEV